MAVRDLTSAIAVVVLCSMLLMMEMSVLASAAGDADFIDTSQEDVYNDIDSVGDNFPELLKLLGALLETRQVNKNFLRDPRPLRTLEPASYDDKKELSSLLDKLTSSLSQEDDQPERPPSHKRYAPIASSKRAREELYGAMPPLNELCRMMKVRCF